MEWRSRVLPNGMAIAFKQNAYGASFLYRRFWLHLPTLDWAHAQACFEREFGPPAPSPVIVLQELDGGAMIGQLGAV